MHYPQIKDKNHIMCRVFPHISYEYYLYNFAIVLSSLLFINILSFYFTPNVQTTFIDYRIVADTPDKRVVAVGNQRHS